MYESHFGITGPPFQLTPDPSFYFDSKGHHLAHAEFRRGLSEASGFIVVSGEIGAGKTTLVRTLLAELDPAAVSVAQVLSTQLNADELLRAILFAFGVAGDHSAQADPASTIRQFLAGLLKESRRAILIIDEAQNLHPDAFEQLAELVAPVPAELAPLQVCLVGQPVALGRDSPDPVAVLRICAGARLVTEAWSSDGDAARRNVQRQLADVGAIVSKIEWLLVHPDEPNSTET